MMPQGNGGKNSLMNMAMDLLDADNDGSIVDDIGGVLKGFLKQ